MLQQNPTPKQEKQNATNGILGIKTKQETCVVLPKNLYLKFNSVEKISAKRQKWKIFYKLQKYYF